MAESSTHRILDASNHRIFETSKYRNLETSINQNTSMRKTLLVLASLGFTLLHAQTSPLLTGTVLGSSPSYDYSTNRSSTTANTPDCAFDGDLSTFYASYSRSNTWVGLDLGTPHVITGVGWSPRNDSQGQRRVRLAVFEGANREDFLDAVPLYMPSEDGTIGEMSYADVSVSRSFRYVRYVGPNDARCNVAEVAFYGDPASGEDSDAAEQLYKPTNLPLVVIHVEGGKDPVDKINDLRMKTTIISADGTEIVSDSGSVRLRGNASMGFPKKPYRIKFDKKRHVLDSPAKAKKWTLINNYGDKTLMRNYLAFDLSRRVEMPFTPFCVPVDVMVNGEYKGCYQLCDQVEVGKGRVEIDEMEATDIEGEALTGGYFIEIDAYAYDEAVYFYSNRSNPVTVKSPDEDVIQTVQLNYLKSYFNTMEASLFKTNFSDPEEGYRQYLDVESFLKHFIVGEFAGNTDTYWSTYMYKPRNDEQFHVGPVWDFDLAYDNDNRTYPINNLTDYIYATKGSYAGQMRSFVNRIIKSDAGAKQQLEAMWAELRNSDKFCEDSLIQVVDDMALWLDESQQLNFKRWNIMNTKVHQNPKIWGSYEKEVENVRSYIRKRIAWFDKKLHYDPAGIHDLVADDTQSAEPLRVYTLNGNLLGTFVSVDDARQQLASGLYIVSQGSYREKVTW